jgi:acetyltransferase-like isoleucine patch superfamily enzyme
VSEPSTESLPRRRWPLPVGRAFWIAKHTVDRAPSRVRRRLLLARVQLHAFWQRAEIEVDVAPTAKVGRGVRVVLTPRTHNRLRIGPYSSIGDRGLVNLNGGEIVFEDWVDMRRDCVLTVAGRLTMEGLNVLQPGIGIHCDESITLKRMASVGERVTIIDSVHYYTAPDEFFADNVRTGKIVVGYNAWVGAKATIGRNVTIGDFSVVAGNALVLDDVPSGHLASGVPAQVIRPVRLPWNES